MAMNVTQLPRPQSHFNPTNVELVNILRRKIDRNKPSRYVTDTHHTLYEKEPWLLQHVSHVRFHENEWFYFVTRKKPPGAKKADSKRPCRKVLGSGRWKMTGNLTQIEDKDGVNIGSMRSISFQAKGETEKDEITTGWVMHEFLLDKPGFQEVVLCRIRFNLRKDNAQYAPRLTPIMMGLEREDGSTLVENNIQTSINNAVAASGGEETQYLDVPVETHQAQGMVQWNGSCSGEAVSSLAPQHQQAHPILNGGMEQDQEYFGSYGQQQNHILGHMEQYGQGFGDMVQYQNQYLGQGTTDPVPAPMMMNQALNEDQQWNGSCSGEVVPYSAPQHQQIMGKDSNYPILNGGMEQQQDFGSYGQQQNHILGHMEQYGQGFGDMVQYQNQYLGQGTTDPAPAPMMMNQALNEDQQWNEYLGPSSAHQYFGQDMVPMIHHQGQHLAAQHQNLSVNASMEQHQGLCSSGQFPGESSGQQQNHILGPQESYLSLMEDNQQQYPNLFWGQERNLSYSAQTMELQQQWNGYSAPYSAQPYDQGMMENQDFGSSALQNNGLSAVGELTAQQQHLGQDFNLSLTQQQNQMLGQATHLPPMGQQFWQTDHQSQLWGQHTDPSQVPAMMNQTMEEQAIYLPMNQGIGEPLGGIVSSPIYNDLTQELLGDEPYPEIDSEMADLLNEEWDQQLRENTPEDKAELTAGLAKSKSIDSLVEFFCRANEK